MMSASVTPSGRLSMSRTMAFLLPSRAAGVASLVVVALDALAFFGGCAGIRAGRAIHRSRGGSSMDATGYEKRLLIP